MQKIDEKAKSLTVDGENVPGWMMAMTMSYTADKEEVFKTVKAGDQITATVKDGDFKTLVQRQGRAERRAEEVDGGVTPFIRAYTTICP